MEITTQLSLKDLGEPPHPEEAVRQDLEDAAKDYSEDDVLIEILQNALDALDQKRYDAIAEAAGLDATEPATVKSWNDAVLKLLEEDYQAFEKARSYQNKEIRISVLHEEWMNEDARRDAWWEALGRAFKADPDVLRKAGSASALSPTLTIRVFPGTKYIEVEDNGVGMDLTGRNISTYLRHKGSTKRKTRVADKRFGERGNHGWGLTSVLAYSDDVQLISKTESSELAGWELRNFRSFADRSALAKIEEMSGEAIEAVLDRSNLSASQSGTIARVSFGAFDSRSQIGWLLENFTLDAFATYLRTKTPVGQVNDYLLHPAFHSYRAKDGVEIAAVDMDGGTEKAVPLDYFPLSEVDATRCVSFPAFQNNQTRGVSVHTVSRYKSSADFHILTAADVQVARLLREFEGDLQKKKAIPAQLNEKGEPDYRLQQSFTFAYSGGLLSPTLALEPKGNILMFRGVTLAEQSLPTLARKHLPRKIDGRSAIASACNRHVSVYEGTRSALTDKAAGGGRKPRNGREAPAARRPRVGSHEEGASGFARPMRVGALHGR